MEIYTIYQARSIYNPAPEPLEFPISSGNNKIYDQASSSPNTTSILLHKDDPNPLSSGWLIINIINY